MLMLTVTLIIACMVTAFACGYSFDPEEDLISANIVASEIHIDPADPPEYAYILFDHLSGDPVDLNNIVIHLSNRSSAREKTSVDKLDVPTGKDEDGDLLSWYILSYGDKADTRVSVGDRFMLYADRVDASGIYWKKDGAQVEFSVPVNDYIDYRIIDERSGRAISAGSIPVPES